LDIQRVVVTGAGSGVGNGIVKALHMAKTVPHIIATDIAPLNAGLFRADEGRIWPKVEDDGALDIILRELVSLRADAVLIGSEYELEFFARNRAVIEAETSVQVVVSPVDLVTMANDKWDTVTCLKENALPHPRTTLPASTDEAIADADEIGWPVIVKPRRGTAARGVHRVIDADALRGIFQPGTGQIVQQKLGRGDGRLDDEYTCSVFRMSDGGLLGPFTARRSLRGGDSWTVEVDNFPDLHPLMMDIGSKLPAMGPLNVQMVLTDSGPIPFEINARFSGTTAIRAHYGFNEPEMALRHFVGGETPANPEIGKGIALRYTEEVFVDGYGADNLAPPLPAGKINRWF